MNAGTLLKRYVNDRLGMHIDRDFYLTNLCQYRPHDNKFENCLDTPQLDDGLEELKADILRIKPKLIVASGGWPLYYLTGMCGLSKDGRKEKPGTGGLSYRGSVLPCTLVEGYKVLVSLHPAFVIRSWGWHPIFLHDLERMKLQSSFPEIRGPQYTSYVNPPADELDTLVGEMCNAEWLSVDIETFPNNTVSCIGFSDREDRGLCITYEQVGWREIARTLLASPSRKLFQYGTFDTNFLRRFHRLETNNWAFDTYIASASLMPEFPRGLDFLTSIYTDFPYYKSDRKIWKKLGDMSILWEYNIKDCIATLVIAKAQMKELTELFGGPVWEKWKVAS